MLGTLLAVSGAFGIAGLRDAGAATDPPSTMAGARLTPEQLLQPAYDAGFRTEAQLTTVIAIGLAESSLYQQARNWHPEYGYRPASTVVGVTGPTAAWSNNQQMHSDRGVWQISSHWWPQYTDAQTDSPAAAARIMWTISKSGQDFTPWDTYKSGAINRHLDTVRPVVRAFLGSGSGSTPPPLATTTVPTVPKTTTTVKQPAVTTTTVKQPILTTTTVKQPVVTTTTVKKPTVSPTTVQKPDEPRRWRSRWWRSSNHRGDRRW